MKIKHLFFLALFVPLTGCGLFGDPPAPKVYYTYGNTTDKTITVNKLNPDGSVYITLFSIAPGEEHTFPPRKYNGITFDGKSGYISVSNGDYLFTQKHGGYSPAYLLLDERYQKARVKGRVIYRKYVFTDYDFSKESGNNLTEVPN